MLSLRNDGCPTPGKVGYESRSEARRMARELRPRFTRSPEHRLAAYLCACGLFHLGNRVHGLPRSDLNRGSL